MSNILNNKVSIAEVVDELYDVKDQNKELVQENLKLQQKVAQLKALSEVSNEMYQLYSGVEQNYMLIVDKEIQRLATIKSDVIPNKGEIVTLTIDGVDKILRVHSVAKLINVNSNANNSTSSVGIYVEGIK